MRDRAHLAAGVTPGLQRLGRPVARPLAVAAFPVRTHERIACRFAIQKRVLGQIFPVVGRPSADRDNSRTNGVRADPVSRRALGEVFTAGVTRHLAPATAFPHTFVVAKFESSACRSTHIVFYFGHVTAFCWNFDICRKFFAAIFYRNLCAEHADVFLAVPAFCVPN